MSVFQLSFVLLLIAASTLVHVAPLLVAALVKALLPSARLRRAVDPLLTGIAASWIGFNNALVDRFSGTRLQVDIEPVLRADGHYLLLANHQSWVDIVVLQRVFNRRIPLMRFFLKRELIWVPLLGLAWWALDFPFMARYSAAQVARRPELAGRDVAATRRACAKFREIPVAIVNFVEGTRFTYDKHARQGAPHRYLLRPKAGGVAFVLDAMGDALESILDVTLAYPGGRPTLADLLAGRMREVRVHVRERPIPRDLLGGDYQGDAAFRARVQAWMNTVWEEKDARVGRMLGADA